MHMNQALLERLSTITDEERRLLEGSPVDRAAYADDPRFIIDSARLLEKGRLITLRPHTRFAPFPRHRHNYVEIMYMCSGSTTHHINDTDTVVLRQGELLLLNQHASHAVDRAGEGDVAVNFIVLPPFFDAAMRMLPADNLLWDFLTGSLRRNSGDGGYLHFRVSDILPVQNLIENMVWTLVHSQPNLHQINQTTMGLLFLQLLEYTDRLELPRRPRNDNARVLHVLREIEDNYQNASLTSCADQLGLSTANLSRLVRQTTGRTFQQLLQQRRLEQAARLLRETTLPAEDIIAAVGYDNTSYFYRLFRSHYGMTPKAYRAVK